MLTSDPAEPSSSPQQSSTAVAEQLAAGQAPQQAAAGMPNQGQASSSLGAAPTSSSSQTPDAMLQRLMERPDLLQKIQDPKVQAALMEVSQSPWKMVKYIFDKDVQDALKEMQELAAKDAQPPSKT